jgi:hypothetical protein
MTAPPATTRPAATIRLIHGALAIGVILFAIVVHFVVRPSSAMTTELPPVVIGVLLGVSLAASGFSVVMRRRVPRRNTNESADLFWTTAALPALLAWAPLEGAALLGIVAYMFTDTPAALVVAGIALAGLIAFNPARLERA